MQNKIVNARKVLDLNRQYIELCEDNDEKCGEVLEFLPWKDKHWDVCATKDENSMSPNSYFCNRVWISHDAYKSK